MIKNTFNLQQDSVVLFANALGFTDVWGSAGSVTFHKGKRQVGFNKMVQ